MAKRKRQRHCFAPGCQTGYKWTKGRQPSLFSVPKDEEKRKLWERNLHRQDKSLDETCAVCELHFEPSCIITDYVHVVNGEEVRIPRGKPELAPDAVPTVLPNAPAYLSKKATQPRPPRKRLNNDAPSPVATKRCKICAHEEAGNSDSSSVCSTGVMSEPVPTVCGASSAPEYLLALNVPSIYWSCHRVADRTFPLYCKLKMDGNEIASERVVIFFTRR